jgi:hypothetical protein
MNFFNYHLEKHKLNSSLFYPSVLLMISHLKRQQFHVET